MLENFLFFIDLIRHFHLDICFVLLASYSFWEVPKAHTLATSQPGSKASISRLLSQATFGPTRETVDELFQQYSDADQSITDTAQRELAVFKAWVQDQFALPPSLHRAYFRQRANPRIFQGLVLPTGSSRAPCDSGSRWRRYGLDDSDRSRTLIATRSAAGNVAVVIDGELRTEVPEAEFLSGLADVSVLAFYMCVCIVEVWILAKQIVVFTIFFLVHILYFLFYQNRMLPHLC